MTVYKFKITFEDQEEISREIEILPTQTFEELHQAIQSAIGFDNSKDASFYMSNDHWIKGEEISLNPKVKNGQKELPLMASSRLCDFIADPHQKIYYISDFTALWTFYVELVKITKQEAGIEYPRCVKKNGEAPKQYGASVLGKASTEFDFLEENLLDEEGDDDELGDDSLELEEEPAMNEDVMDGSDMEEDQQEQDEI